MKSVMILLIALVASTHAQLDMMGSKMDFDDNIAEESQNNEKVLAPKPILNDGKPFYVARDPQTGTLDFNVKKTVGIQNDIPISRKDEIASSASKGHDINSIGHTFHDYLNIPVKYTSSKFVYPLISSSYANMKYQGNNKNHVSNHKNYTQATSQATTMSPKYFTHIVSPSTSVKVIETTTTTKKPIIRTTEARTTVKTTTKAPETIRTTQSTTTTSSTTEAPSTVKYSSTIIQSNQFPTTFKKYIDSSDTRRKTTQVSTPKIETTTMPANPIKFLDDLLESIEEKKETKPTTYRPPTNGQISFFTSMPLKPSAFKPMPTASPGDHQRITFENTNPDVMTLSEIFNSISGNENFSSEYEGADSLQVEVKRPLPLSTPSPVEGTTSVPKALPTIPTKPQKTLQQQMQLENRPQYIDLPVHTPPKFQTISPPMLATQPQVHYGSHVGFPTDSSVFEDYVEFENPKDQYVRYEVQKPNVNLVKFNQMSVPNMNNVVISPGQNSASFVLGSQQNVGSVGVGSSMGVGSSLIVDSGNNGPIKKGQVINEEAPVRQSSIRFPSEVGNSFENAPIIKGTIKLDGSSETVQPPQALAQNPPFTATNQKPLVFPKGDNNVLQAELSVGMTAPTNKNQQGPATFANDPSKIIFENVNDIYERVQDKKTHEAHIPEVASNDLLPQYSLKPPNQIQQNQFNRPPVPPQQPLFRRQPSLNILPQFRPNSRVSQGHPQYKEVVGAIRVPQNPMRPQALPKVGLPPMNPNGHHQINPNNFPNGPQRYPMPPNFRRNPPPPPNQRPFRGPYPPQFKEIESSNRRVFKVPQNQDFPLTQRYMQPPPVQQPAMYYLNRPLNTATPETLQMQQRPSVAVPYQDVELNKSLPPTPALNITRSESDETNGKLEPVVTLQMLQAKKSGGRLNVPPVPQEVTQELNTILPKNHKQEVKKDPSIYVVYPVQGQDSIESQQKLEISEKGVSEELPIPSKNEYVNTPFAVVTHFEQEPLLMKKDKKKIQFPYAIERPTAPQADNRNDKLVTPNYGTSIYNIGEEVPGSAPISSKLTRVTEKPIAIAYTPTEPTRSVSYYHHIPHHLYPNQFESHLGKFQMPNYQSPVIPGADYYHQTQPQNHHQEIEYHQNYDFEAPFHASVILNPEVTNPYEGWSIVTKSSEEINKIDRSDVNTLDLGSDETTKKFDPNEFQPVFESGFQPIYSSNRVSLAPEIVPDFSILPSTPALHQKSASVEERNQPQSTTEMTQKSTTEMTSSAPVAKESTTVKVEEKKEKKKIEIDSLEAFFESLTRDYDDEDETLKSENESRSL